MPQRGERSGYGSVLIAHCRQSKLWWIIQDGVCPMVLCPNGAQGDSPGQSEAPPWDWYARNSPSPERAEPAVRKSMRTCFALSGLWRIGAAAYLGRSRTTQGGASLYPGLSHYAPLGRTIRLRIGVDCTLRAIQVMVGCSGWRLPDCLMPQRGERSGYGSVLIAHCRQSRLWWFIRDGVCPMVLCPNGAQGIAGSLNEARWFYAPTGRKVIAQGKAKRRPGIRYATIFASPERAIPAVRQSMCTCSALSELWRIGASAYLGRSRTTQGGASLYPGLSHYAPLGRTIRSRIGVDCTSQVKKLGDCPRVFWLFILLGPKRSFLAGFVKSPNRWRW
jgi:hypothetical protein